MSELVCEKLTQTLAAGAQWRVGVAGDFFRLAVAPYSVSVSLLVGNRIIGTMAGMLAGDYVKDIHFDGILITNGTTAPDVTMQIAGGGAGSDRVLGEVSVINGELARVKAGMCFTGANYSAPVAGQYSLCQLYNPAASGKNVILNKITAYCTTPNAAFWVGASIATQGAVYHAAGRRTSTIGERGASGRATWLVRTRRGI